MCFRYGRRFCPPPAGGALPLQVKGLLGTGVLHQKRSFQAEQEQIGAVQIPNAPAGVQGKEQEKQKRAIAAAQGDQGEEKKRKQRKGGEHCPKGRFPRDKNVRDAAVGAGKTDSEGELFTCQQLVDGTVRK